MLQCIESSFTLPAQLACCQRMPDAQPRCVAAAALTTLSLSISALQVRVNAVSRGARASNNATGNVIFEAFR